MIEVRWWCLVVLCVVGHAPRCRFGIWITSLWVCGGVAASFCILNASDMNICIDLDGPGKEFTSVPATHVEWNANQILMDSRSERVTGAGQVGILSQVGIAFSLPIPNSKYCRQVRPWRPYRLIGLDSWVKSCYSRVMWSTPSYTIHNIIRGRMGKVKNWESLQGGWWW